MIKLSHTFLILLASFSIGYSQMDEIWLESDPYNFSDTSIINFYTPVQVEEYMQSIAYKTDEILIGGYINSIFHESIDSVKIIVKVDNHVIDSVFTVNGLFNIALKKTGKLIDLSLVHPDYHSIDTSLLFPESGITTVYLAMRPKYKILLRGRVYAGNIPLEGVEVEIKLVEKIFNLTTRGCYYDKDDYWNCLFDGMFKLNLTTDNPNDSIYIQLSKNGMETYKKGMTVNEYSGEIMYMKMKYEKILPVVPYNNFNFKLSFPVLSFKDDWFMALSYYRLINTHSLKRFAYGFDANMYITTVRVTHNTFWGLEPSTVDSTYINAFVGPSLLVWLIPPEKRKFSTYTGCTFAYNFSKPALIFQPFIGTRFFLDINKAISFEIRYCEYKADIVHYVFNPYGSAFTYSVERTFSKLHANLGIQIVF